MLSKYFKMLYNACEYLLRLHIYNINANGVICQNIPIYLNFTMSSGIQSLYEMYSSKTMI